MFIPSPSLAPEFSGSATVQRDKLGRFDISMVSRKRSDLGHVKCKCFQKLISMSVWNTTDEGLIIIPHLTANCLVICENLKETFSKLNYNTGWTADYVADFSLWFTWSRRIWFQGMGRYFRPERARFRRHIRQGVLESGCSSRSSSFPFLWCFCSKMAPGKGNMFNFKISELSWPGVATNRCLIDGRKQAGKKYNYFDDQSGLARGGSWERFVKS